MFKGRPYPVALCGRLVGNMQSNETEGHGIFARAGIFCIVIVYDSLDRIELGGIIAFADDFPGGFKFHSTDRSKA